MGICGRFFIIGPLLLSLSAMAAEGDKCVLVFERDNQQVTKAVRSFFRPVPGVMLKTEAVPLDFLKCIREGASEIMIVAHGFWRKESGFNDPVFQLGYFVRAAAPNGKEVYQPKLFYNKIFEESYKALEKEKAETGTTRLQRIRFAACGIESLKITHPHFTKLLEDFVEEYDEAPKANGLITWLFARKIPGKKRSITHRWLSKSGRCDEAVRWQTKRNSQKVCTRDQQSGCNRAKAKYCRALELSSGPQL